ncbi:GNAT family N-acetyltransferase [Streptomyces youssoufiensis]
MPWTAGACPGHDGDRQPGEYTVPTDDVDVFVRTERLTLRRFTAADVENLVALDSDPRVMRFLTGEPTPRAVIENEVLPKILLDYRLGPAGRWAAVERATGSFLGWLSLQPPADGSVTDVELGYRLKASAWGRGLATEGARALIDKGFAELGVQRVWAETMAVNTASRRVMEKAGLRYVRTFHVHFDDPLPGTEHGEVEYELRRVDWAARRAATAEPAADEPG